MKVFILNGQAESGKNYFAEYTKDISHFRSQHISTVDPIKEFLKKYGVKEKTNQSRVLMSNIKNLLDDYDDLTNKQAIEYTTDSINLDFIFIDCREPWNIDYLKNELSEIYGRNNVKTILMIRPSHNITDCEKDDFEFVSNYNYDYVFECNNLREIKICADGFMKKENLI